ncbi:sirohydrochlorin chelatase [Salimicrobium album]|uniref:Sirohydrochlorin ferrochelatase n=1 Tax=Salimicrobium album TaxID=50717 RepID=A0A1H3GXP7_9BACI|nr:CbiX/SirB N-terminal domain-containing protein [Salimicrobium album]SDY08093.1 sirohydrochlorin ferrochelatase [Salimicrobium album]
MQGVLYVSHGSRIEETKAEVERVVEEAHKGIDIALHKLCYLEIASPSIEEGTWELIAEGAERIAIVPMLLFSAGHYYSDIPDELANLQKKYPNVTFTYGEPLGVQEALIDALADRFSEKGSTDGFLLVARGSRNPATVQAMETIRERLVAKTGSRHGEVCYLAVLEPTFEQGLADAVKKYPVGLIVLPCLWFTGRLIRHIEKEVETLKEEGCNVHTAHYLDNHPFIIELLRRRVQEALVKEPYAPLIEEGTDHESSAAHR